MFAQQLLIIVRTVLRSAMRMVDAAFRGLPERDGHLQRPDRQVVLHAIADCPADDAAGMALLHKSREGFIS
ncbi:conserved hypothetical protein [Ruegeria sp. TrichCH4B]|nr:conserved hypothetical protein [Ruegeria sp. TrichCH4B]